MTFEAMLSDAVSNILFDTATDGVTVKYCRAGEVDVDTIAVFQSLTLDEAVMLNVHGDARYVFFMASIFDNFSVTEPIEDDYIILNAGLADEFQYYVTKPYTLKADQTWKCLVLKEIRLTPSEPQDYLTSVGPPPY